MINENSDSPPDQLATWSVRMSKRLRSLCRHMAQGRLKSQAKWVLEVDRGSKQKESKEAQDLEGEGGQTDDSPEDEAPKKEDDSPEDEVPEEEAPEKDTPVDEFRNDEHEGDELSIGDVFEGIEADADIKLPLEFD